MSLRWPASDCQCIGKNNGTDSLQRPAGDAARGRPINGSTERCLVNSGNPSPIRAFTSDPLGIRRRNPSLHQCLLSHTHWRCRTSTHWTPTNSPTQLGGCPITKLHISALRIDVSDQMVAIAHDRVRTDSEDKSPLPHALQARRVSCARRSRLLSKLKSSVSVVEGIQSADLCQCVICRCALQSLSVRFTELLYAFCSAYEYVSTSLHTRMRLCNLGTRASTKIFELGSWSARLAAHTLLAHHCLAAVEENKRSIWEESALTSR
jgi:hypothetical protein